MIDWHCHLLPGLDDGSRNLDESLAMGRLLAEAGFTDIYCTPHCLHGAYDNTPRGVRYATSGLQQAFLEHGIPLTLHPGMEYYLDEIMLANLDDLQPLGDTRLVLVEAAQQASPEFVKQALFQLLRRKWVPVMAHPERFPLFERSPARETPCGWLRRLWPLRKMSSLPVVQQTEPLTQTLVNMGCLFQGNISSFAGWYGPDVTEQARLHLAGGLYDYFGTDAHNPKGLKKTLAAGLDAIAALQAENCRGDGILAKG